MFETLHQPLAVLIFGWLMFAARAGAHEPKRSATELARRYRELGGSAEIVVLPGLGHGGKVLYESEPLLNFLLAD